MLCSFADKAIMTKAMSMYGRRLRTEDYMELLHKKSVHDIAAYLKDTSGYHHISAEIQPSTIHRGQLEMLLRKERFARYLRLLHFDNSNPRESFYGYCIKRIEAEQILQMIQLLNANRAEEFIVQYPAFFDRYSKVDLMAMAKVRSFDGLLQVLQGTEYEPLLSQCRPKQGEKIDYTACEVSLMSHYYEHIEGMIDQKFHGKTKKHLHEIFQIHLELCNVVTVYRLKKYFPDAPPEFVARCILPIWKRIPPKQLDRMIHTPSAEAFLDEIAHSPFSKLIGSDDFTFIEYSTSQINYRVNKRFLRFATDAPTAFSAYLTLCDIELANVTAIIEGVRYDIPPSEIKKMLIL